MPSNIPLVLQTTWFHADDRAAAVELGELLYDRLTRPRSHPLAFGPGLPVRIATAPVNVAASAAQHNLVVPIFGDEDAYASATESLGAWRETLGVGLSCPWCSTTCGIARGSSSG